MDANLTQTLSQDTQDLQNAVKEMFSETLKALPKPPSWVESAVDFVKLHPWISLVIFLLAVFLISMIIREFLCSYLKTNEILARLKRLEERSGGPQRP